MKLARIDHIRCSEYSATTFVWVEDTMTEEYLQEAVDQAITEYLTASQEHMKLEKPGMSGYGVPNWEKNRDRLVGDVLDEQTEQRRVRKEWEKARSAARRGFDAYLCDQEGIVSFWDAKLDINAEVDWGHSHGQDIDYGETDWPRFRLLKTVKSGKPGRPVVQIFEEDEWL